jgi:hypothetical protein
MKQIIGLPAVVFLLICVFVPAGMAAESLLPRKNAVAFKLGAQIYSQSAFTDFWGNNSGSLTGPVFEFDYDRRIFNFLFVDVTLGYSVADQDSTGIPLDTASSTVSLSTLYLSPTLKALAPLNNSVFFYGGIGPDIAYADSEIEITLGGTKTRISDSDVALGGHALVGLEWLFYKKPARDGYLDAPLGLIFEYKFAFIPINDFDQDAIDTINAGLGTNFASNDFDAGGHYLFIGLKWHF